MEGWVDFGVGYGVSVRKQTQIYAPLDSDQTGSQTYDLLIASPTPYRYATESPGWNS